MTSVIIKWVGGSILGLGLAWAIYAGVLRPVLKPNPSTTQKADIITNYTFNNTPRSTFGCSNVRIDKIPMNKVE